ncbi:MAG: PEP-CTERM sorting domain-containing protein [Terriglobales bacterium]
MTHCKRYMITFTALIFAGLLALPAAAQSTLRLTSSGQIVDFVTGTQPGSLMVVLAWTPGYVDPPDALVLSGSAVGSGNLSDPNYSLTTSSPIALAAMGPGVFAATAAGLQAATLVATSPETGATLFTGHLTSLTFSQPLQGSNEVSLQATVVGEGPSASTQLTLLGQIALAAGATISQVASSRVGTDLGGMVVPEPATLLLFVTGLFLLFWTVSRRRLGGIA